MFGSVRRLLLPTLLVVLAGGAVFAVLRDERPPREPAPSPAAPLSAARLAAIDRLLQASGALEVREITAAERQAFTRTCRSLSTTDRLLRAERARCLAVGAASAADNVLKTCSSYAECGSELRVLRSAFDREITATRRLNDVIRGTVADRRCQAALRAPASDLRLLDAYARGLTVLQTAYDKRSEPLVKRALGGLAGVPLDTLRSVRSQRADLRRACR